MPEILMYNPYAVSCMGEARVYRSGSGCWKKSGMRIKGKEGICYVGNMLERTKGIRKSVSLEVKRKSIPQLHNLINFFRDGIEKQRVANLEFERKTSIATKYCICYSIRCAQHAVDDLR